jgi:hypothetical protein
MIARPWPGGHDAPGHCRCTTSQLVDDDARRRCAGRERCRGAGQLSKVAPLHGEGAHGADAALVDIKRPAIGAQAGVNCANAPGRTDRSAAEQDQGPVRCDPVAGNITRRGVHREQELAVVADLDPARGGLGVSERRSPDRRQRSVPGHVEGRDGPQAGPIVGIRDKQLERVRGAELTAERPETLGGGGEPGAAVNSPPKPTEKLSICEVPVRLPTRALPIELNSTSSG